MAAAESDRDSPSTLSAEFLNFSAKDTSAVSGSPSYPAYRPCCHPGRTNSHAALSLFWCRLFPPAQLSGTANVEAKRAIRIEKHRTPCPGVACDSASRRHNGGSCRAITGNLLSVGPGSLRWAPGVLDGDPRCFPPTSLNRRETSQRRVRDTHSASEAAAADNTCDADASVHWLASPDGDVAVIERPDRTPLWSKQLLMSSLIGIDCSPSLVRRCHRGG